MAVFLSPLILLPTLLPFHGQFDLQKNHSYFLDPSVPVIRMGLGWDTGCDLDAHCFVFDEWCVQSPSKRVFQTRIPRVHTKRGCSRHFATTPAAFPVHPAAARYQKLDHVYKHDCNYPGVRHFGDSSRGQFKHIDEVRWEMQEHAAP